MSDFQLRYYTAKNNYLGFFPEKFSLTMNHIRRSYGLNLGLEYRPDGNNCIHIFAQCPTQMGKVNFFVEDINGRFDDYYFNNYPVKKSSVIYLTADDFVEVG